MYTDQQIQNLVAELSRNLVALFGNAIESAGLSIDNLGDETPDEVVAIALVTAHTTAARQAIELVTLFSALPELAGNEAWQTASSRMVSSFSAFIDGVETPGTNVEKLQNVVDFVNALGALPVPYTGTALGDTELGKFFGRADTALTRFEMIDAFRDGDYSRLATTIAMCAVGYAVDAIIVAGLAAIGAVSWPFLIIGACVAWTVSAFFEDEIEEFFQSQFANEEAAFVIEQYTRLYGGEFSNFDSINAVAQVGTAGADVSFGLPGRLNLIGGGAGEDLLVGDELTDILGGGSGSDRLEGRGGDDILIAGDDDDIMIGGIGNDTLEGGDGNDTYRFVAADFGPGSDDVIIDSDGLGSITFDGVAIGDSLLNNVSRDGFGWETNDRVFRLQVIDSGDSASLMLIHRETGGRITISNWSNGDLGITLPDLGQPGTPENPFPLTNGDDLIGFDGDDDSGTPVSGDDVISGLAGNDGIDGGYGDDWIDGGHDDDLLLGGPGSNRLIGGLGNDIILNYANVMGWAPWSDPTYGDQFDTRSDAVSHGNGWFAYNETGATNVNNAPQHLLGLQVWAWGPADGNPETEDIWVDLDPNVFKNGDDEIDAGDGSDTAYGGEGDDRIAGGTGNDLLIGGSDNDFVNGEDGDDLILGDDLTYGTSLFSYLSTRISTTANVSGNDVLIGGQGNDRISGQGGIDVIDGGEGDDVLSGDRIDFVLGMAIDQPVVSGNDNINGGAGNDWISGDGGDDTLSGGTGTDKIFGDSTTLDASEHGKDVIKGDAGNDELYGGGGDDEIDGGADDDIIFGEDGNDRLQGGAGLDELIGGLGNDSLSGGDGNDKLWGEAGTDRLDGGTGADELQGGDGTDTLIGGEGDDKLWGDAGNDSASGGNGLDQIAGGDGNDMLDGGAGNDILNGNAGQDTLWGGVGNDNLSGNEDNDTVEGGDGNDYVGGDAGNDVLAGNAGNDNLFGGDGDDQVNGGDGSDYADGGAGADTLVGDAGNDTLLGNDGDDRLEGGTGNDVMVGGSGNDTYVFARGFGIDRISNLADGGADVISFASDIETTDLSYAAQGQDLVIYVDGTEDVLIVGGFFGPAATATLGFSDGSSITQEQLRLALGLEPAISGTPDSDVLTGTYGNDTIYGGGGDDSIYGLGGNDYLNGGDGNDSLYGALGDDALDGGAGNDNYYFSQGFGFDTIQGLAAASSGSDVIRLGTGLTTNNVTVMIDGDNISLTFSNGYGQNASIDSLILEGFLAASNGTHVIQFPNGQVWSASYIRGSIGTGLDDVLTGSSSDDTLRGHGGNDTLHGLGGNDSLYGGVGNDSLLGGTGADRLWGDEGDDSLDGGDGNDTVIDGGAGNDFLAGGAGNDGLTGGGGNDVIEGGIGDDGLDGGDGIDSLDGGQGNDSLSGGSGDDLVVGGSGNDLINGDDGNDRLLGGDDNDSIYGGLGSDELIGGNGDDQLLGSEGDDVLDGGAGNDTLHSGEGRNTYVFGRGYGVDEVTRWNSETLRLLEGITAADLRFSLKDIPGSGSRLVIGLQGSEDQIEFQFGWENIWEGLSELFPIDRIEFADGTVWGPAEISAALSDVLIYGDENGNVLTGSNLDNLIRGNGGNDSILGLGGNDNVGGGTGNDFIDAGDGNDLASGGHGEDHVLGGRGDDVVEGGHGNDLIEGGEGNDYLWGETAQQLDYSGSSNPSDMNDVIIGGLGDDTMDGGLGDDTYVLEVGHGSDVITDFNTAYNSGNWSRDPGYDRILFGPGISLQDMTFELVDRAPGTGGQAGDRDLVITNTITGDQTRIEYMVLHEYYLNEGPRFSSIIDQIVFEDGTTLDYYEMLSRAGYTGPGITMNGGELSGLITGTPWKDRLRGSEGDDVIDGGTDASYELSGSYDELSGGDGSDTYLFGRNSGQDRIYDTYYLYGTPTASNGVDTVRFASDIRPEDVVVSYYGIRIRGSAANLYAMNGIEEFRFADGTVWTMADVNYMAANQSPSEFNDSIYGTEGADTINALEGNDSLYGSDGNDQLAGGAGDDQVGGDGGNDLVVGGSGQDSLYGDAGDDILRGDEGGDYLAGGDGNDDLDGGMGIDSMEGGAGDDLYRVDSADDVALESEWRYDPVTEQFSEVDPGGTDTVLASVGYALGQYVENLTLVGGDALSGEGNSLDNTLTGNAGSNLLTGHAGNDALLGGSGSDVLMGGAGNDSLSGGADNDTLDGGDGDDSFHFELGTGSDVIHSQDAAGLYVDRIVVGPGIASTDILTQRIDNDLVLTVSGTQDSLTVKDFFSGEASSTGAIDSIHFGDGTVWNTAYILNLFPPEDNAIIGTSDSEFIAGTAGDDVLRGLGGNDVLLGASGNDVMEGGAGNDFSVGDEGNDTFRYGLDWGDDSINAVDYNADGIGFDTIEFGAGISASDIVVSTDGANLVLTRQGSSDRLQVNNWAYSSNAADGSNLQIDEFRFADGTVWTTADIDTRLMTGDATDQVLLMRSDGGTIDALGGNDTIYGSDSNDVLTGGAGFDSLFGREGDDIYRYELGWGHDALDTRDFNGDGAGFDAIEFGQGIAAADIDVVSYDGSSVILTHRVSGDSVHVDRWHYSSDAADQFSTQVDEIRFVDGTVWTAAEVTARLTTGNDTNQRLSGTPRGDTIDASGGNDVVEGFAGDDMLSGGAGNDSVSGGAGNDVLIGGTGDDALTGGEGDDTYRFELGWGSDVLENIDFNGNGFGTDVIEFGQGINASDIEVAESEGNVTLTHRITGDRILLLGWGFSSNEVNAYNYQLDEIRFFDGTVWTNALASTFSTTWQDQPASGQMFTSSLPAMTSPDDMETAGATMERRPTSAGVSRPRGLLSEIRAASFEREDDLYEAIVRDGFSATTTSFGPSEIDSARTIADCRRLIDLMATSEGFGRERFNPHVSESAYQLVP